MAHIGIRNSCRNAEAEQKDKQGWVIIFSVALRTRVKINSHFGRRPISPGCITYMDVVGKGREHAYRDGGRATQDAVAEDAEALPTRT